MDSLIHVDVSHVTCFISVRIKLFNDDLFLFQVNNFGTTSGRLIMAAVSKVTL